MCKSGVSSTCRRWSNQGHWHLYHGWSERHKKYFYILIWRGSLHWDDLNSKYRINQRADRWGYRFSFKETQNLFTPRNLNHCRYSNGIFFPSCSYIWPTVQRWLLDTRQVFTCQILIWETLHLGSYESHHEEIYFTWIISGKNLMYKGLWKKLEKRNCCPQAFKYLWKLVWHRKPHQMPRLYMFLHL